MEERAQQHDRDGAAPAPRGMVLRPMSRSIPFFQYWLSNSSSLLHVRRKPASVLPLRVRDDTHPTGRGIRLIRPKQRPCNADGHQIVRDKSLSGNCTRRGYVPNSGLIIIPSARASTQCSRDHPSTCDQSAHVCGVVQFSPGSTWPSIQCMVNMVVSAWHMTACLMRSRQWTVEGGGGAQVSR